MLFHTFLVGIFIFLIGKDIYSSYKNLQIAECRAMVEDETDKFADILQSIKTNALDLALIGELLLNEHFTSPDRIANYAVIKNFRIHNIATGGGIWYLPYMFGKERELACFYAFKKGDSIILDPSFSTQDYFYPNQNWFLNAMQYFSDDQGKNLREVVWSPAYTDTAGTYALMTTASAAIIKPNGEIAGLATIDWSLAAIAKDIANIRPMQGTITALVDVPNNVVLSLNTPASNEYQQLLPLSTLPWFHPNAQKEQSVRINGEDYLSFARKFDNGMMAIVNVPKRELFHTLNHGLILASLSLLIVMFGVTALIWSLLHRFINKPVAKLCHAAREVGSGNLDISFTSFSQDELGSLSKSFATMVASLKEHIMHIEAITSEKSRLATELHIARDIQRAMLPSTFLSQQNCSLSAVMEPATDVGGDFYDFFFIEEQLLAIVIADVSGKSIPAALFMAIAKTLLHNCIQNCHDAGAALTAANTQICENNSACMFVTAFVGILNLESGEFSYSNAAHLPFYLLENNKDFKSVKSIQSESSLPLGVMMNAAYKTYHIRLSPGATIFFYTDGVTEAINTDGKFFGTEELEATLSDNIPYSLSDLSKFLDSIKMRLATFTQNASRNDDITMLAVSWLPMRPGQEK